MPTIGTAEGIRIATFHAELTRKGPGLLLRDIARGEDAQIDALKGLLKEITPDVLLLTKVDFDAEQRTSRALQDALGFSHFITVTPNSMLPTPFDLDGDGQIGDRQTWARYAGEGAMLLLSHFPLKLRFHLGDVLWKDLPDPRLPIDSAGKAFPSESAQNAMRIVGQGVWVVDVLPNDRSAFTLVAFQNQTPVFDGPEDLNGARSRAQLSILTLLMDGHFGDFPTKSFVLLGNANLDPERGQGDREAMAALLSDPRIQDPKPKSELGGTATATWEKPGAMRVSYILPSRNWRIERSQVVWPDTGPLRKQAEQASRHRMVWSDLTRRAE